MSKSIPLSQGRFAIVDDADFEWLSQWKWCALKTNATTWYAVRRGTATFVYMHRLILAACKGQIVDHINRDGLDNQRANLRFCTKSENAANSKRRKLHTSRFRGVSWDSARQKWYAKISSGSNTIRGLGRFKSEEKAAAAYNEAAKRRYRQFAQLNVMNKGE